MAQIDKRRTFLTCLLREGKMNCQ